MRFLLVAVVGILLFACESSDSRNKKIIKDVFQNYKEAVIAGDGKEAVKWIDQNTIDYYQTLSKWILYADSSTIAGLSFLDRMSVLTAKQRIPLKLLLNDLDGASFFEYAVNYGMIGKSNLEKLGVGPLKINGNLAEGNIVNDGKEMRSTHKFNRNEQGDWKFDVSAMFIAGTYGMLQMIENNGITENEFIYQNIESLTGRKPKALIWHPVKRR